MNINQRNRILQNVESLVDLTDFDELCQACYQNHLLSSIMIKNICMADPRNISGDISDEGVLKRERHKKLFVKLTKRGPDAFEKLRRIFVALNYKQALNKLFGNNGGMISIRSSKRSGEPLAESDQVFEENTGENLNINTQYAVTATTNEKNNVFLHEYEGLIQPKKNLRVRLGTRITIDPTMGTYVMESKNNRGIFFVVSSVGDQQDQDEDIHLLLSLFKQLGFKLYAYSNITLAQFFDLLEELLASEKVFGIECFVLAVKSGCRIINGIQCITFNDGSVLKVEQIQRYFYHQNCRGLVGRPKIFIYPYSEIPNERLTNSKKVQTDSVSRESGIKHISQVSDVIICYATTKGGMDDQDSGNYSRYIQCFVDIIAQYACDTHFENILKIIQDRVAKLSISNGRLQMASYDNISFNKVLYFNPGLSINE